MYYVALYFFTEFFSWPEFRQTDCTLIWFKEIFQLRLRVVFYNFVCFSASCLWLDIKGVFAKLNESATSTDNEISFDKNALKY